MAARSEGPADILRRRRPRAGAEGAGSEAGNVGDGSANGGTSDEAGEPGSGGAARPAATERRRAALVLLGIWRDLARDLALVAIGERGRIRDVALLEDLEAALAKDPDPASHGSAPTAADSPSVALARLARAAELISGNVSPELVLDSMALHWGPSGSGSSLAPARGGGGPVPEGSRR
jgi:hypothetical protein